MNRTLRFAVLALVASVATSCTDSAEQGPAAASAPEAKGESAPAASAPQPAAEAVTAANLLVSERFWPYRVALTEALSVPGRKDPLAAGAQGVLIRVEASGQPRIDFGTAGKFEVPLEKTDLLARADVIRVGQQVKQEPNFVHAIKTRMIDSSAETLRPLDTRTAEGARAFLCVFADPAAAVFADVATALAPLSERSGLMTIVFPQGEHPDPGVRERLRALGWPVPFLPDFLSEPYTRTLLTDGSPIPYVLLQTPEGRVIVEGAWQGELRETLGAAVDRALPIAPASAPLEPAPG